jgi:hypothetical protein
MDIMDGGLVYTRSMRAERWTFWDLVLLTLLSINRILDKSMRANSIRALIPFCKWYGKNMNSRRIEDLRPHMLPLKLNLKFVINDVIYIKMISLSDTAWG